MRTALQTVVAVNSLQKHPLAVKTYGIDLSAYCDRTGTTIASVGTVTQLDQDDATDGLTIEDEAVNTAEFPGQASGTEVAIGKGIQLTISGGTAGNDYRITVPFTDSDGETDAVVLVLKVRDAATYTQE